jgi:drug/metabolite transporter (DMT)-like permease
MLRASMTAPARNAEPHAPMSSERRTGALLVVAAATLWSTGGVGVKVAVAEPMVIAGLRSVFALVFTCVVLAFGLRRGGADVVWALLRRPLVWGAAASYALMVLSFVVATRLTTAANAVFIQYTAPVYVAVLGGPLLGERITKRDLGAVAACVVGMGLAFGGELGGGRAAGNALAVLSSFGFAGLPLLLRLDQRRLLAKTGDDRRDEEATRIAGHAPLLTISLGNAIAALVALPAIVAHPIAGESAAATWVVLVALGFFQIGLPYVLYSVAVRRLRALESSLLATIEPVLSPVWVVLATGEVPSALALAGGAIIVVAVAAQGIAASRRG